MLRTPVRQMTYVGRPRTGRGAPGTVAEREQFGARHVTGGELVGFADVDHAGAVGEALGEVVDVDLGDGHGATLATPASLPADGSSTRCRSAGVLTLRSRLAATGAAT